MIISAGAVLKISRMKRSSDVPFSVAVKSPFSPQRARCSRMNSGRSVLRSLLALICTPAASARRSLRLISWRSFLSRRSRCSSNVVIPRRSINGAGSSTPNVAVLFVDSAACVMALIMRACAASSLRSRNRLSGALVLMSAPASAAAMSSVPLVSLEGSGASSTVA